MNLKHILLAFVFFCTTLIVGSVLVKPPVACAQSNNCCSDGGWVWQHVGGSCEDLSGSGGSNEWQRGYEACQQHACGACQVPSVCGNNSCDPGENAGTCAQDCTTGGMSVTPPPAAASQPAIPTSGICASGSPTARSCQGQAINSRCVGYAGTCVANGTSTGGILCGCKPDVVTACPNTGAGAAAVCITGSGTCNADGRSAVNGGLGCGQSGYICCSASRVSTPTNPVGTVVTSSGAANQALASGATFVQVQAVSTTGQTTTITQVNNRYCDGGQNEGSCTGNQICAAGPNGYICQTPTTVANQVIAQRTFVNATGCDAQPSTTATTARQFLCGNSCKWAGELVANGQTCGGPRATPAPVTSLTIGTPCTQNTQCQSGYCQPAIGTNGQADGDGRCAVRATPIPTTPQVVGNFVNNTACTDNSQCQSRCCSNVTSAAGTTLRLCSVATNCQIQPVPSNPITIPVCTGYATALPGTNRSTQCRSETTSGSAITILYQCNTGYVDNGLSTHLCIVQTTVPQIAPKPLVTPIPTPTPTPIPTFRPTPSPTVRPTATPTPRPTPSPTPRTTPVPTVENLMQKTPIVAQTATPIATPKATLPPKIATPVPTPSSTPTSIINSVQNFIGSIIPGGSTPSPTPKPVATLTPRVLPTATPTSIINSVQNFIGSIIPGGSTPTPVPKFTPKPTVLATLTPKPSATSGALARLIDSTPSPTPKPSVTPGALANALNRTPTPSPTPIPTAVPLSCVQAHGTVINRTTNLYCCDNVQHQGICPNPKERELCPNDALRCTCSGRASTTIQPGERCPDYLSTITITPRAVVPTLTNCGQITNAATCSSTPGCSFSFTNNRCEIVVLKAECTTITDQTSCVASTGCRWNTTLRSCEAGTLSFSSPTPSPTPAINQLASCDSVCTNILGCNCPVGCGSKTTNIIQRICGFVTPRPSPTASPTPLPWSRRVNSSCGGTAHGAVLARESGVTYYCCEGLVANQACQFGINSIGADIPACSSCEPANGLLANIQGCGRCPNDEYHVEADGKYYCGKGTQTCRPTCVTGSYSCNANGLSEDYCVAPLTKVTRQCGSGGCDATTGRCRACAGECVTPLGSSLGNNSCGTGRSSAVGACTNGQVCCTAYIAPVSPLAACQQQFNQNPLPRIAGTNPGGTTAECIQMLREDGVNIEQVQSAYLISNPALALALSAANVSIAPVSPLTPTGNGTCAGTCVSSPTNSLGVQQSCQQLGKQLATGICANPSNFVCCRDVELPSKLQLCKADLEDGNPIGLSAECVSLLTQAGYDVGTIQTEYGIRNPAVVTVDTIGNAVVGSIQSTVEVINTFSVRSQAIDAAVKSGQIDPLTAAGLAFYSVGDVVSGGMLDVTNNSIQFAQQQCSAGDVDCILHLGGVAGNALLTSASLLEVVGIEPNASTVKNITDDYISLNSILDEELLPHNNLVRPIDSIDDINLGFVDNLDDGRRTITRLPDGNYIDGEGEIIYADEIDITDPRYTIIDDTEDIPRIGSGRNISDDVDINLNPCPGSLSMGAHKIVNPQVAGISTESMSKLLAVGCDTYIAPDSPVTQIANDLDTADEPLQPRDITATTPPRVSDVPPITPVQQVTNVVTNTVQQVENTVISVVDHITNIGDPSNTVISVSQAVDRSFSELEAAALIQGQSRNPLTQNVVTRQTGIAIMTGANELNVTNNIVENVNQYWFGPNGEVTTMRFGEQNYSISVQLDDIGQVTRNGTDTIAVARRQAGLIGEDFAVAMNRISNSLTGTDQVNMIIRQSADDILIVPIDLTVVRRATGEIDPELVRRYVLTNVLTNSDADQFALRMTQRQFERMTDLGFNQVGFGEELTGRQLAENALSYTVFGSRVDDEVAQALNNTYWGYDFSGTPIQYEQINASGNHMYGWTVLKQQTPESATMTQVYNHLGMNGSTAMRQNFIPAVEAIQDRFSLSLSFPNGKTLYNESVIPIQLNQSLDSLTRTRIDQQRIELTKRWEALYGTNPNNGITSRMAANIGLNADVILSRALESILTVGDDPSPILHLLVTDLNAVNYDQFISDALSPVGILHESDPSQTLNALQRTAEWRIASGNGGGIYPLPTALNDGRTVLLNPVPVVSAMLHNGSRDAISNLEFTVFGMNLVSGEEIGMVSRLTQDSNVPALFTTANSPEHGEAMGSFGIVNLPDGRTSIAYSPGANAGPVRRLRFTEIANNPALLVNEINRQLDSIDQALGINTRAP